MASATLLVPALLSFLLLWTGFCQGTEDKYLEDDYVFRVKNSSGEVCLTASFKVNFDLYYENVTYNESQTIVNVTHQSIEMPNMTMVEVSGSCDSDTSVLTLSWMRNATNFSATFEFAIYHQLRQWFLTSARLDFELEENNFKNPYDPGIKEYKTSETANKYFNRTFSLDDYYYCKTDTKVWFSNITSDSCYVVDVKGKNRTVCSFMTLSNSVIYVGDLDNRADLNRKICIGDYIKLQELIVPIAVGVILAILLVVIFVAYAAAYIARRRKEGRYETLSNGY